MSGALLGEVENKKKGGKSYHLFSPKLILLLNNGLTFVRGVKKCSN